MNDKLQLDFNCPYCYKTVTKVIAENGLIHKTNKPKGLTKEDKQAQKSDNLLKLDFTSDMPNQKIVTDMISTCLAVSIDDNMR